jgi:hypothetical protein
MLRTANDLFIGSRIRLDEETIGVVDYLVVDEDGVWIEGYEESSGDEFNRIFDYDDEVDIIYDKG